MLGLVWLRRLSDLGRWPKAPGQLKATILVRARRYTFKSFLPSMRGIQNGKLLYGSNVLAVAISNNNLL